MQKIKIELKTRQQIAEFLPSAMRTAIASYQLFSEKVLSSDDKEFKDHHNACKVAIAHIELLVKLTKIAELSDLEFDSKDNQNMLLGLIKSAQGEIDGHKE